MPISRRSGKPIKDLNIISSANWQSELAEEVSIGAFLTFYVIFTPLEYIRTMSKRLHFFGFSFIYVINIFCTFQTINSAFLTAHGRLIHKYLRKFVFVFKILFFFSHNISDYYSPTHHW